MDINKVFPKPKEVEEELKRKREDDEKKAEKEELERIKSLAPPIQAPKMSQLIEERHHFIGLFYLFSKSGPDWRPFSGLASFKPLSH